MLHAMHKRTRIGCESLIQEAINECANPTIKKYILRNYTKNTHQWALWARQHSPLLLQVTSTNALESYHSELKSTTSPKYGLIGNCLCIFNSNTFNSNQNFDQVHAKKQLRLMKKDGPIQNVLLMNFVSKRSLSLVLMTKFSLKSISSPSLFNKCLLTNVALLMHEQKRENQHQDLRL